MEILNLTCTPHDEPCAQVGSDGYRKNSFLECEALIDQLRRKYGPEPAGARLKMISNPHDFGTYYEVGIQYNEDNEEAVEYALLLESGIPSNWDEPSKEFLRVAGYTL